MTILKEYRINNDFGQKEMADKLDRQEQELKKYEKPQKKSSELPPELLAKFDSIRKSMLDLSQE